MGSVSARSSQSLVPVLAPNPDVFLAILGALIPNGGAALALVEAHFDESYGGKDKGVLCLAGYLMTERMARRFSREWSSVLRQYDLPFFRMSACAHGNKPFDKLSLEDRIIVQTKMIELIKKRTIMGICVTVDLDEYKEFAKSAPVIPSPYTFLINVVIGGVIKWIEDNKFTGDIAYFFEAGHKSQSEAQRIMDAVFHDPALKSSLNYAAHAFVDKEKSPPTQSADLLAWQWFTDMRRKSEGRERRQDCYSLMKHSHQAVHVPAEKMLELVDKWSRKSGQLPSSSLASLILS